MAVDLWESRTAKSRQGTNGLPLLVPFAVQRGWWSPRRVSAWRYVWAAFGIQSALPHSPISAGPSVRPACLPPIFGRNALEERGGGARGHFASQEVLSRKARQ